MTILLKRGTRSAFNDQSNRGLLQAGEPLFITDESRLGVGNSASSYSTFVKESEITNVVRTTDLTNVAAAGTLADKTTSTSNYYPTFNNIWVNNNVTIDVPTARITVSRAGVYLVHIQQLVSTGGTAAYLYTRKNGVTMAQAYSDGDNSYDLVSSISIYLAANDYIDFFYSGTTTYAWGNAHSYFYLQRVSYV